MSENVVCPRCEQAQSSAAEPCPGCLLKAGLDPSESGLAEAPTVMTSPESAATLLMDADSQGVSPPRATNSPERIGDYEILGEIARGGMGVVYRARQKSLDRVVALKMILQGAFASSDEEARFRLEAEAAARLDHPHIVPIYEIGEHEGRSFFSMKLIDARSLRKEFARLRREPRRLGALMLTLARALQHAHERGVLHRDLKPANILLDQDGQPHLTDFGLARKLEGDSGLTQTGAVVGTPSYMAPEQARGEADLTTAVDVYGLGAIFYEALTGRPPFTGKTPFETIYRVLEREVTRPRAIDAGIDPELEIICLRCLEKEPHRRYATVEALAEDLSRWLKHEPILARRPSLSYRTTKWVRRRPAIAGLVAVAGLAALTLLVGGLWFNSRLMVERNRAKKDLRRALISGGAAKRLVGKRWEALESLREAAELGLDAEVRREAFAAAASPGLRLRGRFGPRPRGSKGDLYDEVMAGMGGSYSKPGVLPPRFGFSGDGSLFFAYLGCVPRAGGAYKNRCAAYDLSSGRRIAEALADALAIAPKGRLLALTRSEGVRLWDPLLDRVLFEISGADKPLFSPGGGRVLVRRGDESELWDINQRARVAGPFTGYALAFVDDNRALWAGDLALRDLNTGALSAVAPSLSGGRLAAFSDDGAVIIASGPDMETGRASLCGAERGVDLAGFYREVTDASGACYAPRSGRLAVAPRRDSPVIDVWSMVSGARVARLRASAAAVPGGALNRGAFHPEGVLLAAQNGKSGDLGVTVWNTDKSEKIAQLSGLLFPVWSPDGRFLAAVSSGPWNKVSGGGTHYKVFEVKTPQPSRALGVKVEGMAARGSILAVEDRVFSLAGAGFGRQPLGQKPSFAPFTVDEAGRVWSLRKVIQQGEVSHDALEVERLDPRRGARRVFRLPRQASWGDECSVQAQALHPSGRRLFVIFDGWDKIGCGGRLNRPPSMEIWDLEGERRVAASAEEYVSRSYSGARYSPDGSVLVVWGTGGLTFVDPKSGRLEKALKFPLLRPKSGPDRQGEDIPQNQSVCDAVFFGDRIYVAVSDFRGLTGQVAIVDARSRALVKRWLAHKGSVRVVAADPKGRFIASGGEDGDIRLWTPLGRELVSWKAHDLGLAGLFVDPAGRGLVSGSFAGELKLWRLPAIRAELAKIGLDWE